jgi:hypothetical protein
MRQWLGGAGFSCTLSAARDSGKQAGQSSDAGTPLGDALAWAEQQADRLDPLKESPASIVDRKSEMEPAYVSYYGYRKPDPAFDSPSRFGE